MLRRIVSSVVLPAVLLGAVQASAQGLEWTADLNSAQRTAAQTNRLVLIHFGGPWCPPCRMMEEQVFAKPGLHYAVTPNFVPVKVDVQAGEQNELVRRFGVEAFPCDIIMTPQGTEVARSTGFKAAPEYLSMLNQAAQTARSAPLQTAGAVAPTAGPPPPAAMNVAPLPVQAALPPRAGAPPAPALPTPLPQGPAAGVSPPPVGALPPAGALPPSVGMRPAPAPPAPYVAQPVPPSAPPSAPSVVPSTPPLGAAPQPAPPATHSTQAGPATAPPAAGRPAGVPGLPPGSPPLALDGYCPVTVTEKMTWKKGDVRYGAIHRGRTYLFHSATEQAKFLADPDSFSPIMSGNDPVAWLEQGRPVPGKRDYGVVFRGANRQDRMILFASEASREKFRSDQNRYEFEIKQAMQAVEGGTMRR